MKNEKEIRRKKKREEKEERDKRQATSEKARNMGIKTTQTNLQSAGKAS